MSSLNFNSGGYGFSSDMNVLIPSATVPSSSYSFLGHVGDRGSEKSDIPFQILNPLMFQPHENMVTSRINDEGGEGYFGNEKKSLSLKLGEEVEGNSSSATEKIRHTKLCVRGHWKPAEDAKLKELVAQFGPQNWNNIAEHLEGRSGKSCRLRWFNQLDPRINKTAFTEEEEEKLLAAHKIYGNKWAMISRLFPGRTDNAVKNHWHVIMARRQREQSSLYRKRKPTFQSPSMGLNMMTLSSNAVSESTISTTSTCTNLSLTTMPFHKQNPVQNYQAYGSQMGLLGESNFFSAWKGSSEEDHMGKLMSVDQSNYSESNSEVVSVSESVATNRTNVAILGESENLRDKNKVSFIDFLGVGAT